MEAPVHWAQQGACAVALALVLMTAAETFFTGRQAPTFKLLGLPPGAQVSATWVRVANAAGCAVTKGHVPATGRFA